MADKNKYHKNDHKERDKDAEVGGGGGGEGEEKRTMILMKPRDETENRGAPPTTQTARPQPPTKIVRNEGRERPGEPKITPRPRMIRPVKLIDESYEFCQSSLEYLRDFDSNFLVVGVVGGRGVGKSTIMNILARESMDSTETNSKPLGDEENSTVIEDGSHSLPKEIFECQSIDDIEKGLSRTTGIDLYVTRSRVILLDVAAAEGCGISKTPALKGPIAGSGLELTAFLLAVCHVIVLVQDWFVDINMLRFVQCAEMVKPTVQAAANPQQITHSTMSNTTGSVDAADSQYAGEHHPHLLFLHNKCVMDDFNPESVRFVQDLYRKSFGKSKLQIESGLFMYDSKSDDSSRSLHGLFHNLNEERCGSPLNLFLFPMIDHSENEKTMYRGYPNVEELAKRLKSQVFGASKGQLTNVLLTERTWLHYCNKTWDNIKKSTFFIEYSRLLP